MPTGDPFMWLIGSVGLFVLAAAALEFGYSRFGDARTTFDRIAFALSSVLVIILLGWKALDEGRWPGLGWTAAGLAGAAWITRLFRRVPGDTTGTPDPDFGSLRHDGDQWVGEYDTGGPEPTGVVLGNARSGASARQRREFLDFRAAYPALEPRIRDFLDPDGSAPPGDWWLVYVDTSRKAESDEVELTYESRSSKTIRAIELRGDLRDPTVREITIPEPDSN